MKFKELTGEETLDIEDGVVGIKWERALTPEEVKRLHDDPLMFLRESGYPFTFLPHLRPEQAKAALEGKE
jgi:hypothetical protein